MSARGVTGTNERLFQSYLSNSTQLDKLQFNSNTNSSMGHCWPSESSVRGSVLGPMLFLLLTDNLPHHLSDGECQTVMYVDKTVIILARKTKKKLTSNVHDVYTKIKEYCSLKQPSSKATENCMGCFKTKNKHIDAKLARAEPSNKDKASWSNDDSSLIWKSHHD